MSDSDKESDSGSGSGSDRDESGSDNESGSGSGSGSDSGSKSGSGSGSSSKSSNSGSSSSSSDNSGKKKKKKKDKDKGKENAIDDMPKMPIFFEIQNIMRSILSDLNGVEKKVDEIGMRWNPKPVPQKPPQPPPPQPQPPKRPSPTRNYFPPGYSGNYVHFDDDAELNGVAEGVSEHGGATSYASHGRTSRQQSCDNLSSQRYPMQTPVPYPVSSRAGGQMQIMQQSPMFSSVREVLPANFGATGPYTKYLKTATNPEPNFTNRFFKHEPSQMRPLTSRFVNTARNNSPNQQQQQRTYSQAHDQQQQQQQQAMMHSAMHSGRPPVHGMSQGPTGYQQATTMQDYDQVPQMAIVDMNSDSTARAGYLQTKQPPQLGPPAGVGSATERVNLAQIENAIDCLLAQ